MASAEPLFTGIDGGGTTTGAGRVPGDLAFGCPVMELCNHPEFLTDGTEDYGGNDKERPGYLGIHWPAFITVDLGRPQTVGAVCFKLWDWDDPLNKAPWSEENKKMLYAYRLLVSEDRQKWKVLHDCAELGEESRFRRGWQRFSFQPETVRFIRIHCLRNLRNSGFHIVKLRAFASADNAFFRSPEPGAEYSRELSGPPPVEIGDGTPLSVRLLNLAGQIQEIRDRCEARRDILRKDGQANGPKTELEFFEAVLEDLRRQGDVSGDVVDRLFVRGHEVQTVAASVDESRSLLARPVETEWREKIRQERTDFARDFWFGLFQFLVVCALLFFGRHWLAAALCFASSLVFIVVFRLCFVRSREKGAPSGTRSPGPGGGTSARAVCDSSGNRAGRDGGEDGACDKRPTISILLEPSFGTGMHALRYNEKSGYHSVPTPGWIDFDFGVARETRYIRFLLWDNAGSGKRQRSHRTYNYRVLFRKDAASAWEVLHDTMGNGSCGWQEIVKEGGTPWLIRHLRIYGISNSGATGGGSLQLVRLGISGAPCDADIRYAIRNRQVKYGDDSGVDEDGAPDIMRIVAWLRTRVAAPAPATLEEWKDAGDRLLGSCGRKPSGGASPNRELLNLMGDVSRFVDRFIGSGLSVDSGEDFARDLQSLVSATLAPVRAAKETQSRFDSWMRIPKTILVLAAVVPIVHDSNVSNLAKETTGWMTRLVSIGGPIIQYTAIAAGATLLFFIWVSPLLEKLLGKHRRRSRIPPRGKPRRRKAPPGSRSIPAE